jgi:Fe-Mn family superoxide dismutase
MAHNNHLFFSAISPDPPPMSSNMVLQITTSFSSPASLRSTFLATATAMFGPGFVWLVKKKNFVAGRHNDSLAILTTYNAGSPYPGAHFRQQPIDMATSTSAITGTTTPQQYATMHPAGSAGVMGQYSKHDKKAAPGGADLDVLLGVSTWEHVWLRDWGVGGKRQFLEAWWERIDWGVVDELVGASGKNRPLMDLGPRR